MSLAAAAAAMGIPEALVERAAAARAAETGSSVDEIIAAWAGGETVAAASPPPVEASQPAAAPSEPVSETKVATPQPAAIIETAPPVVSQATARAPMPETVTPGEAAHLPEVVTVPTAGIKERTNFVIPKWLTAVMLVVPLIALFALGGATTGECGEATELAADVITGNIVNCDGSAFTGQQVGGGGTDFIALGGDIFAGTAVAGVNCAGCHGANGEGTAAFPALTGVLTTFGSCTDHVEWVTLGSGGFTGQGSYGDTNKPVAGGMPSFSGSLTPEQIAAVSAFERVRFGGEDPDAALVDCGLGVETDGEGETDPNTEGGEAEAPVEASAASSG